MISRVYITNFRRIEKADIEIRDGLTCLTGQNGTGKSSIIEAIEFCLYGKTKSGTNKDTIRRHGAGDDEPTYTSVDFEIGDRHYRCRRYLTKRGSTEATLHAYDADAYERLRAVNDDETDLATGQRDLNDMGILVATKPSGVNEAVISLFGMKYNEFVASFVARQKELDSLASNLTPEARKKFFLELLDYSKLDSVKTEYNKEIRALDTALATLDRQLVSPEETQKQIDAITKELDTLDSRIAKGNGAVATQESRLAEIDRQLTSLSVEASQLEAAERSLTDSQVALTREQAAIDQLTQDEQRLRSESAGYDPQTGVAVQLGNVKREIEQAVAYDAQRRDREQMSGILAQRKTELAAAVAKIETLSPKVSEDKLPDVDGKSAAVTGAKETLAKLTARKGMLDGELMKIRGLVSSVESGQAATCPTCGTDISSETGRAHLDSELTRLSTAIAEVSVSIEEAQKDVRDKEQLLASERRMLVTYQNDVRDLDNAKTNRRNLEGDIREREANIATRDAYLTEHEGERRSDIQRADLEARKADLEQKLAREEAMRKAFLALQTTTERLEATRRRMRDLQEAISTSRQFVKSHGKVREQHSKLTASRAGEQEKLTRYRDALAGLQRSQGEKQSNLKNLQVTLQRAQEQARDRASMLAQKETYVGAREVVSFLREYLPSKIAPTLSMRASKLLDVATNGMYHMIEIDESYDVYVYTDDDVRPIAMMSGGEQDIISLCIRIAIAEMILSATGIQKQTLILDEIFGALDDERRTSSCRALQSLGAMIPRIICITHIEEIKDLADYTYVVERDENGVSHVREVKDGTMGTMPRILATDVPADLSGSSDVAGGKPTVEEPSAEDATDAAAGASEGEM